MSDRFFQPVDAIVVTKRAPVRSPLSPELVELGRRRVAAGENAKTVAEELLRTLGGPGSGNFGHAGRPGEVGGSSTETTSSTSSSEVVYHKGGLTIRGGLAAMDFRRTVNEIPDALVSSAAKEIAIIGDDKEAAQKIDDYLLKNYNFDLQGQALSMVDRTKATVIATKNTAATTFARTLHTKFLSQNWEDAVKAAGVPEKEEAFVDSFARLFADKGPLLPIAEMANPVAFTLEQAETAFKHWGWK